MAAIKPSRSVKVKAKAEPPSHSDDLVRLSKIRGQIDGIERMIKEHRYCPDIMNQIRSVTSALRSVEKQMMHRHLKHCVTSALKSGNKNEADNKIRELMEIFDR
jgi:DNA-binding FrmR family transcriptional regulator